MFQCNFISLKCTNCYWNMTSKAIFEMFHFVNVHTVSCTRYIGTFAKSQMILHWKCLQQAFSVIEMHPIDSAMLLYAHILFALYLNICAANDLCCHLQQIPCKAIVVYCILLVLLCDLFDGIRNKFRYLVTFPDIFQFTMDAFMFYARFCFMME